MPSYLRVITKPDIINIPFIKKKINSVFVCVYFNEVLSFPGEPTS